MIGLIADDLMVRPFNHSSPPSPAPADARSHAPWPLWRKILAYLILTILALLSIWLVDRKVVGLKPTDLQPAPEQQAN